MNLTIIPPKVAKPALIKVYKSTCQYCTKEFPDEELQVDHIDPITKGGTGTLENYTLACKRCNALKHNMKLEEPGRSLLLTVAKRKAWTIMRIIQSRKERRFDRPPWDINWGKLSEFTEENGSDAAVYTERGMRRLTRLSSSRYRDRNKWHGFGIFWINALTYIDPVAIQFLFTLKKYGTWHENSHDLFGHHGILTVPLADQKMPNGTPWKVVLQNLCWLEQCSFHYNSIKFCRLIDGWTPEQPEESTSKIEFQMLWPNRNLLQAFRSLIKLKDST